MPSKANTSNKIREDNLYLRKNPIDVDDDSVDPSDLLTPSLKALYEMKDKLFKEEQKRIQEFRKQEKIIQRQIKKENERVTAMRLASAAVFERRHKRDSDHVKLMKRAKDLDNVEKNFEKHELPKAKKIIYNIKKVLDRRPKYSCDLLLFREIDEGDLEHYKKTIQRNGKRYRQIFAGFASVQGDIMPFNNKRTYREDSLEVWRKLNHILRTDVGIKRVLKILEISSHVDVIIVKSAVLLANNDNNKAAKKYKPQNRRLFNSVSSHAIYRNDISYALNQQARTFSDMFGIHLEQYTIDNFKANSCYLNLIVNTWHDEFDKRRPNGTRKFAELTYDAICKAIGVTNKNQDIGISIKESKAFFKKFRLGLDVVNVYGQILETFRPEKLNDHIFPQVLRVLVHNNHTYQLDSSAKNKLDKLRARTEKREPSIDEVSTLYVSDKYKLRQPVLDKCDVHFIDKLDDCVLTIMDTKATKIRFITNTPLLNILFEMTHAKYTPHMVFAGNKITSLGFKVGLVTATIEPTDNTAPEDMMIELDSKAIYEEYHKADDEFYGNILQKRLKSEYPKAVLDIDLKYQMGPSSGYFTKKRNIEDETHDKDLYNAIDVVKAYTHCLTMIKSVPVFGYFDRYQSYDNHAIEDHTLYCVEATEWNFAIALLFPCDYTRCFGYMLKFAQAHKIEFTIKYFRRPSRIEDVNYQTPVDTLYKNNSLSNNHKKHIVNKTTGLIEKWQNKANICKVFSTFVEAQHYQIKFGGRIFSLQESQMDQLYDCIECMSIEEINIQRMKDFLDCDVFSLDTYFAKYKFIDEPAIEDMSIDEINIQRMKDFLECDVFSLDTFFAKYKFVDNPVEVYGEETQGETVHILVIDKIADLVDGYRTIKEQIYNNMSIFMFNLYNKVIDAGIKPKGIKTDAILVFESKAELEKHFTFNPDVIGGLRFESGKTCTDSPIVQKYNDPFSIPQVAINVIKLKDEYDTNELNNIFDKHDRVMIKGLYPGVGKSTSVINYNNNTTLFVTPFNKLAQQTRIKGCDAITANMLLGYYGDGKDYIKSISYDVSKYKHICFDELLINPPDILHKIDVFMLKHTDKKFFATGDVDQLQPINCSDNNVSNIPKYILNCIDHMFPNQITLKINKRLKTDEQRNKLYQLKKDIFNLKKDPLQTLKSYGFPTIHRYSQIKTTQNICYFNHYTISVNKHVHTTLVSQPKKNAFTINGTKYWPGLELVCKKHYKKNGIRMFVNYTYEITFIDNSQFTIKDIVEDKQFTFPIDILSHFQLSYANTCHSVQGLSIDGPITIFNVNVPHVDRYYIWTAITRATDLSNITIYQHSNDEINSLKASKLKQYFQLKVEGYKIQDKNSFRKYKCKEYITPEWINDMFYDLEVQSCVVCHTPYETYIENGKVHSNLTVDRIDSSLAHTTNNCRLLCCQCNRTKSNRY